MECDPLTLSLDTLIAVSPMLGHKLEDRACVRRKQDPALLRTTQAVSTTPLSNPAQQALFLVAPLDLLVTEAGGRKRFHITETNGTGIGGLTNMPADVIRTVLSGLTEMARRLPE